MTRSRAASSRGHIPTNAEANETRPESSSADKDSSAHSADSSSMVVSPPTTTTMISNMCSPVKAGDPDQRSRLIQIESSTVNPCRA